MPAQAMREACLRSFLALLAEASSYRSIDLAAVAAHAGVPLSVLRTVCASTDDLLAAFFRDTDQRVLADAAPADEPAPESRAERLFAVLMCRLTVLEPHRAAVATLSRSIRRDPLLALRMLHLSAISQRWMLASAGQPCTGLSGAMRARGLALMFAATVEVWLRDDDPTHRRTMDFLAAELAKGERWLKRLDRE